MPRLAAYFEQIPRAARTFGITTGPGGRCAPEGLPAAVAAVQVVAVRLKR